MNMLFASGHIVDLALVLVAIEAVCVVVWCRSTGRNGALGGFLVNLASGVSLMLALRCALVGAWWVWIAGCLLLSLLCHLGDLRHRLAAQP